MNKLHAKPEKAFVSDYVLLKPRLVNLETISFNHQQFSPKPEKAKETKVPELWTTVKKVEH